MIMHERVCKKITKSKSIPLLSSERKHMEWGSESTRKLPKWMMYISSVRHRVTKSTSISDIAFAIVHFWIPIDRSHQTITKDKRKIHQQIYDFFFRCSRRFEFITPPPMLSNESYNVRADWRRNSSLIWRAPLHIQRSKLQKRNLCR